MEVKGHLGARNLINVSNGKLLEVYKFTLEK